MTVWSDRVRERLLALLAEVPVISYADIAAVLSQELGISVTKNATIGYARRTGVPARRQAAKPRRNGQRLRRRPHVTKVRLAPRPPLPKPRPKAGTLTLIQLEAGDCKWPVNDKLPFLFCGEPQAPDCVYCLAHAQRAYQRGRS